MTTLTSSVPVQGTLFEVEPQARRSCAVAEGYRGPTVCQIAGITYRQLDYWTRTGLVTASINAAAGSGSQRLYSFRDVLLIRIIKSLLDAGISLRNVRKALAHLNGRGVGELSGLTLLSDGTTVYECTSADQIVDLLSGGQGVFGVAVPGIVADLSGTITRFPSHRPETESEPESEGSVEGGCADGVVVDELAARRAGKATA